MQCTNADESAPTSGFESLAQEENQLSIESNIYAWIEDLFFDSIYTSENNNGAKKCRFSVVVVIYSNSVLKNIDLIWAKYVCPISRWLWLSTESILNKAKQKKTKATWKRRVREYKNDRLIKWQIKSMWFTFVRCVIWLSKAFLGVWFCARSPPIVQSIKIIQFKCRKKKMLHLKYYGNCIRVLYKCVLSCDYANVIIISCKIYFIHFDVVQKEWRL